MKYGPLFAGMLFATAALAQTPTISPLNPLLTPGGATQTFTCTASCGSGPTWSCANSSNGGTCLGSINSGTGVYTPPASLAANQSVGGYQLLPNDHIFNTNISGLAADTATHFSVNIGTPAEPGLSRTSNVATVVWSPSGIQPPPGQTVTIAGANDSSFNGTVTVITEGNCPGHSFSCITYSNPGPNTTSGNGTVSFTNIAASGPGTINYLPSLPVNYANGATPTDTMNFFYTPANNGSFQTPQWPTANIQGGWFDALSGNPNVDHHMLVIDTTTGNINERYQYFATAAITTCTVNGSNSATCTITPTDTSSGFQRVAALGLTVTVGSFTGGDTYLNGVQTLTAATATSITFNITHSSATTSTTGNVTTDVTGGTCSLAGTCNSRAGIKYTANDYVLPTTITADAGGLEILPLTLRAQEVNYACANSGSINHALRMTNQNFYIGSSFVWPATRQASPGGTVPYGTRYRLKAAYNISTYSACAQILLMQLKNYGTILADGGANFQVTTDFDNLWPTGASALKEINAANIPSSNWETVDESSLMEVSISGAATSGEVVTYTASTGSASTNVNLQGTGISTNTNQYYIMAGTPQQQLTFYSNAGAFTCAMSPTVGSITSGCLYTPPASEASVTKTTVTATSSVNAAVKAQMIVYVTPATARFTQDTADYTDSQGNVWYSGGAYGVGMSNVPSWQGCCQNDNAIGGTDKQLFWNRLYSSQTQEDYKFDLHVPAGTYQVTFNNGTSLPTGADVRYFYAQGGLISTIDSSASVGQNKQWTLRSNVVVGGNNTLSFYNTGIGQQTNNTGDISSISISLIPPNGTGIMSGVTIPSGGQMQ